jgi:cholesterol transport system auxiliary component
VNRALAASRALLALGAAALLAACGGASNSPPAPRSYDLGMAPVSAKLPPLHLTAVRATAPYDGTEMLYRLAWRDGAEVAAFAHSRWAAPPPELVRKRLLLALPATGNPPCGLALELHEFTQVFSSKESSEARLELRAQLYGSGGARLASRSVSVTEPNAGAEASSGAAALGRAADRALAELAAWIASQAACRS